MPAKLELAERLVPYTPLAAALSPFSQCNAIRALVLVHARVRHSHPCAASAQAGCGGAPRRAQPPVRKAQQAEGLRDPPQPAVAARAGKRIKMRRLIAFLAAAQAFKQQRDDNKPRGKRNVLFMIADDLRPQLGHLGHRDVDTPQIDRLAKTGVSFRRAYCQAPACNPSRNSFLTGMYPDVSKVFYFEGVTHLTLGKRGELDVFSHMRSHGFITMGVGKLWHWEPIGEPFTRGTGAHFPRWGTYSQEWGCEDKDAGA